MAFSLIPTRVFLLIAFLLASIALAQTTSSPAATASVYPGTSKWEYVGCQNETTNLNNTNGLRALNNGINEALDGMTVDTCLNYCAGGSYAFAGLEYTRECYCSQFLSSLSTKLPESSCDLACMGNSSQICGGSLSLTVYQAKTSKKGAGVQVKQAPMSSVLALGIALAVLFCLA